MGGLIWGLDMGGLIWGASYGGLDIVGNVPTPASNFTAQVVSRHSERNYK